MSLGLSITMFFVMSIMYFSLLITFIEYCLTIASIAIVLFVYLCIINIAENEKNKLQTIEEINSTPLNDDTTNIQPTENIGQPKHITVIKPKDEDYDDVIIKVENSRTKKAKHIVRPTKR